MHYFAHQAQKDENIDEYFKIQKKLENILNNGVN
ncbi:hypothetical protein N173_07935 [Acinetobacter baumannii EGD-HP18]|jgi:hypothetical protein|uniref:Uncharacterized protein n=1 Tax=Acinetobacter baumannii EGD-HP18 TaxID=1358412 RepID=A0AAV3JWY8_ACIBA|nr:hypothetical protein N173_07935 [Acinetobacter baumannii EGD-HP18]